MPTRKQRRRQQKARRHEWEYVYVDEEGEEVPVDPAELKQAKEERTPARNGRRPPASKQGPRRAGRTVEPPSWNRVTKRALFIGPVVVLAMLLLNRHMPLVNRLVPAVVLLAFFLPFSYFTDSLAYRMYVKRQKQAQGGERGRS
jgi:hypothetical protein